MATDTKKPARLIASQDLVSYFNLIPIYNKIVKPYPVSNRTEGLDPTLYPYISDLPGKLDFETDYYLLNLLRDPQAVESGPEIKPLDLETLKEAFSLKEGPIPGFDASILGTDENNHPSFGLNNGTESYSTDLDHNGERRHKKKKKKRRHEYDEEGHSHEHKKKKKKKKDKERRDEYSEEYSLQSAEQ